MFASVMEVNSNRMVLSKSILWMRSQGRYRLHVPVANGPGFAFKAVEGLWLLQERSTREKGTVGTNMGTFHNQAYCTCHVHRLARIRAALQISSKLNEELAANTTA